MTSRLYYDDSYLTTFAAHVTDVAGDGLRIYLDRTAFYPTSGGQPFDTGSLGGARVVDVVDEGERLAHVLSSPAASLAAGAAVDGAVDWARRFDHMQQHSGQHVLSSVFEDLFGHTTVSVHFGDDSATVDIDAPSIGVEKIARAELRANEIVTGNRPVTVSFVDAASATGLRKPPPRDGTLRVVTIDGIDRSACGGTHVRATGEIGAIFLRRVDRVRGTARIEFVCGARAVRRARADYLAVSEIANALSSSADEAPALVTAQAARLRDAESARKRAEGELARLEGRALYDATMPDDDGMRRAFSRAESGSVEQLRAVAQAFCSRPRALFAAFVARPPLVLVATSDDSGVDAGAVLKRALEQVGGKGGGNARIAQGTAPGADRLEEVARAVLASA
ncbi:MAG: DHHA1 domain-containing protein [Gemmatimonadaceae bacterium]